MKTDQSNAQAAFLLVHEFDAPKKLVFNAFSDKDALGEWWGPVETNNSVISLDFRVGGIFHFKMERDGHVNYGRFLFKSIKPYDLLEFTNAFADENANPVTAPFDISLPVEILYRLEFTEARGKTKITLTGTPVDASGIEQETFKSIRESMKQGFGATFNALSMYLEQVLKLSTNN